MHTYQFRPNFKPIVCHGSSTASQIFHKAKLHLSYISEHSRAYAWSGARPGIQQQPIHGRASSTTWARGTWISVNYLQLYCLTLEYIIYFYPKLLMHFVASNTFIISLLTYIITKITLRAIFGLKYLLYSSVKQHSSPSAFGSIRNSAFSSALYRKTISCNSRHKALVTTMTRYQAGYS